VRYHRPGMPSFAPESTLPNAPLSGRTIALCVTGSIAAYKAPIVARLLIKAGAKVVPIMTKSASEFIGASTLAGICGEPVASLMWDPSFAGELHVAIAARADVVAIVPATADILARMAAGRADDLATAVALCARGPVVVAPAMHPRMWLHPATQRNAQTLAEDGRVTFVGPVHGEVASGETGVGRMAEPEMVAAAITRAFAKRDMDGLRVVVTAGPTLEDLDPVRFLGNRSSGKMGFAIADRAAARGASVTLVTGPVDLPTPLGVRRIDVRGAIAMRGAVWQVAGLDLALTDALVMAAAVADYRPAEMSATKIKKQGDNASIDLVRNPDILAEIGAARVGARPVLVGFAVETEKAQALVDYARQKLVAKKIDFVVANEAEASFGKDDNRATFVAPDRAEGLPTMGKHALADLILDRVLSRLSSG
jgi:phosphopantothenoylcysteine decarboxylase/phosphopantothenate--cysteine ligase